MFQTAFTYQLTHFARFLSLPERIQHTPFRNLSLEPLRQRNTALDAFFYDIKVITPEEAFYISDSLAATGSIMIVPPTGQAKLTLCDTLDEYFLRGGDGITVLALAGAGGSALGAAAFARNVADAAGKPVATVVPGYGVADAIGEAMGGSFLFAWLNQVRHSFGSVDESTEHAQLGVDPEKTASVSTCRNRCRDMQTVLALLADPRAKITLLTAHSRGNTLLSEALTHMRRSDPERLKALAAATRIVTFGAKVAMPSVFTHVIDVIGEWDWYGKMNSRPFIPTDLKVNSAWHHTNTDIPGYIDVTNVMRDILAADNGQEAAAPDAVIDPAPAEHPPATMAETPGEPAEIETSAIQTETDAGTDTDAGAEPVAASEPDIEAAPEQAVPHPVMAEKTAVVPMPQRSLTTVAPAKRRARKPRKTN